MPDSGPLFFSAIAARSAIVIVVIILGFRLFGKRQVSGMNILDLVLVLALANAVQNAVTSGSGQLGVGIAAAGTLILINRALGIAFVRRPWLEASLTGTATVVVKSGQFRPEPMRREGVSEDEIMAAIRGYGLDDVEQVELAVLETDGSLSVVPKDPPAAVPPSQPTA